MDSSGNQGDCEKLEVYHHHLDSILSIPIIMGRMVDHVFQVDADRCFGCAACIALCPVNALHLDDKLSVVEELECTHCNHCIPLCPVHALSIVKLVTT